MELQRIGKGTFSTAFSFNGNSVALVSWDFVRECQALGWFPDSILFPEVSIANDAIEEIALKKVRTQKFCRVYTMPFYERITAPKKQLNSEAYSLYKELRKLTSTRGMFSLRDKIKVLDINESFRNDLLEAIYGLSNYGTDIVFEISPRNIAATKHCDLVLRDCFFFESQLRESRGSL